MKWQLCNAAALATFMLAGAIPAQAKTVKEVVRTGDLDLASEQGAAELTVRVAEAAWRVCDKTFDMQPKAAIDQCASRLAVRYRPAVR